MIWVTFEMSRAPRRDIDKTVERRLRSVLGANVSVLDLIVTRSGSLSFRFAGLGRDGRLPFVPLGL